ncbi:non-ribosomal peptide synthetase [Parapedobacter indicus]|uniref:Amino acid adenylation domain-containing protein n=1 Tax=Parapedobacter indicus TaxID=1477437 RepID=A0A1I3QTV0_9SPHI|nr:non-ribosomal peptide synthetase [Parapedobacter indicus]PPL00243.1 amino acid adenylation domain-containing protein [Parapedobacter indicus]SFJ37528.1 amino acid adenylation domain-containing protein [Parapedobacter indicus]
MKPHNYTTIAVDFDPFAQGEIEKTIHLTESQEEIWTACIIGGTEANCSYNESLSLILRGDFQHEAMLHALQAVVNRHEALRATISANGEHLCIHAEHRIELHREDLSSLPAAEQAVSLENYGIRDAETPFDLKNAPLFRVAIFKLGEKEHHIRLTAHHIVCDGWSFGIILEDLGALYTAYVTGEPAALEPAIGFSAYASETSAYERTAAYNESLSYWVEKYTDEIPEINLPLDHPRAASRSYASFRKDSRLDQAIVKKIKELGQSTNTSMVNVLIALFEVYLHKLTGQQEFAFGLPTSGQLATGNFNLVGHCVNLLPIRSTVNPAQSFSTYLAKRKDELLNDYDHQLVGYGAILKALKIKRQKSTLPLISTIFNVDLGISEKIIFQGLDYAIVSNPRKFDVFDFSVNLTQSLGEYVLEWSYNTGLFDPDSIDRMANGFLHLLKDVLKHPHDTIRTYTQIDAHQQAVIDHLNDTTFTYDKSQTVHGMFQKAAARHAGKTAIVFEDRRMDYAELEWQSNQYARYLIDRGVKKGDRIGIVLFRNIDLIVSLLATMKAGGVFVPIDPHLPQARIEQILNTVEAKLAIVNEPFSYTAGETLTTAQIAAASRHYHEEAITAEIAGGDLLYIIFTSGSTGTPKGVKVTHSNLVNFLISTQEEPGMTADDRFLFITPISFDAAMLLFLPLIAGAALIIADDEAIRDGRRIHEMMIAHQVSWMATTPTVWKMILDSGWDTRLDMIVQSGGEPLGQALAAQLLERCTSLWNVYGPTETTIAVLNKQIVTADAPITLGKPLKNTKIQLLDSHGNNVPIGQVGELCISGDCVSEGYYGDPALTAHAFVPAPHAAESHAMMYKSGDLGKYLPNGEIQYVGRMDQQVKLRGHRIELQEIEQCLLQQSGVKDAVVHAVDDQKGDKTLVGYIVPDANDASLWKDRWEDLYTLGVKSEETLPLLDQNLDLAIVSQYYQGADIEEQGVEWTQEGLKRLKALNAKKIVELGTGGGHLLFALGADVEAYVATDYSEVAINKLKEKLSIHPEKWQHVKAYTAMADDFTGIEPLAYDLVFLHGVAQYFPSLQYLENVIRKATSALKAGGCIYIGDMQTLGAVAMHFYLDQLAITSDQTPIETFREVTELRIKKEEELSVDPEFFYNLPAIIPAISSVDVQIRGGNYLNEGTKCHYDIWLYVGDTAPKAAAPHIELTWDSASDAQWLQQQLTTYPDQIVRVTQIPNSRLSRDFALQQLINQSENHTHIQALKDRMQSIPVSGFNPSDLWAIGEQQGYAAHVRWSSDGSDGCIEAVFIPKGLAVIPEKPQLSETSPARTHAWQSEEAVQVVRFPEHQIKRWKSALQATLPDYMVPAFYMVLNRIPLSANGKIDRTKLPKPAEALENAVTESYKAPQTHAERLLSTIWSDLLLVKDISTTSNFFELGGHSLIAVKVMLAIERETGKRLPITSLFENSTIEKLARLIDDNPEEQQEQTASMQPNDMSAIAAHAPFRIIPTIEPQREIWLACELGGDNANNAYTITFDQELVGPLHPEALRKAAQQLVDRHETLRANFSDDGSELIIKHRAAVDWTFRDLSDRTADEQAAFIEKEVQKQANRVFDLKNDVLFTVSLYRVAEEQHHLILTTHHIVFDGWSYNAAMTELGAFYSAFVTNTAPKIGIAPKFSDYASEEHAYYQSSEHEAVVKFWLSRLDGALVPVELPTDYPRPKQRTYHSSRASFSLSAERFDMLKQISKKANCSVAMVLRSILEVFLYRMTGQVDIITGMPVAGQLLTNREHLIGHCVNMLPVRTQIDGNTSFPDYLKTRKAQLLEEFSHQKITFSTLLPRLNISRDKSRPPLISVVMNTGVWLDDGTTLFHGLRNDLKDAPKSFENFEIVLDAIEHADGMRMRWDYHTALFKPETIAAFQHRFEQVISQLGADEGLKIDQVSLLLPTERNGSALPSPYRNDDRLETLLKAAVDRHADQIALSSTREKITYRELDLRSNRLANVLIKNGIKPGEAVGMALNRSIDAIVALVAIVKSGAAYLPLDLRYPQERINQIVSGALLKVVIAEKQGPFTFPTVEKHVTIESLLAQCTAVDAAAPHVPSDPDRIVYILHTSGSTGTPKGVCMGQRALVNLLKWQMEASAATAGFNTLQFSPLTFDVSFQEIFSTLLTGGTLSLIADEARMDPGQLLQHIHNHSIHRLFLPFVALQSLADHAMTFNPVPSSLKEVMTAGEQLKITPQIASFFKTTGATLFNQYGPTETHVVTQFRLPEDPDKWPVLPPIGRPIPHTPIFILNEQLVEEPPGVIGELCVAGAALADGYLNAPSKTAERFKAFRGAASDPAMRIYKTGDLARRMPDGNIEFIGRKDSQIKLRGFRIELGEIEHVLTKQPGIQEAVVMLREDTGTKQLAAYLVLQSDGVFERQAVIAQLKTELPDYMIPTVWAIIPAVPLTKSGKVDRKALGAFAPSVEKPHADDKIAAQTDTQQKLVQLWRSCLNATDIGIRDDFFELGGHSLVAVKLMSQIHRNFGIKFPLGSLFENSTIEQQAKLIDEKQDPMQWDCVIPIRKEGNKPPLYFVHGALLDILYVRNLLPYLDPAQPLYGIQGMGLSGKSEAAGTVEKIAAHYVKAILAQNPEGPYALAGFSSGGLLAFEMTKQLEGLGKQVHFLGLIDTFTPKLQFGGFTSWFGFYSVVIKEGIKQYTAKLAFLFAGLLLVDALLKNTLGKVNQRRYKRLFPADYWRSKAQLIHALAQRKYNATPYRANAYLFRSPDEPGVSGLADYDTNGWGPVIGDQLTVIPIKHVHTQLFFPESVSDVAEKIQQGIDDSWKKYIERIAETEFA